MNKNDTCEHGVDEKGMDCGRITLSSWVISLAKVRKSSLDKISTFVVNRWTKGMKQACYERSTQSEQYFHC